MNDERDTQIRHAIGARGSLTINNVSGSVQLRGTDGEEASVVARGSSGETPQLVVRRRDGALLVEPERRGLGGFIGGSFGMGPASVDFVVEVPRAARVEVSTVSADIDADGLIGEQQYKTVSGDIEIVATAGRLAVTTVSGDARIQADERVELTGTTTSGDLRLRAPDIDLLRVRTVSGDVSVAGAFRVGPEHHVESVSGDLLVEADSGLTVDARRALHLAARGGQSQVVGDGRARLTYRSMSGDVHVSGGLPAGAGTSPASDASSAPGGGAQPSPTARARATMDARTDDVDPYAAEAAVAAADAPTEVVEAASPPDRSLEILRALERGEIDVEEATRLLEVAERG